MCRRLHRTPATHRCEILASLETGEDAVHSAPVRVYDRDSIWVPTQHTGVDLTPENLAHDIRVALAPDR